jgi:hypothetical protein
MCLIIYKNKSAKLNLDFLEESLINAYTYNKDGLGIAVKRNGKLHVDKSKKTVSEFIDMILKYKTYIRQSEFIIHLRRASVNTPISSLAKHPIVINNEPYEREIFHTTNNSVLVHNGYFKEFPGSYKLSDSCNFAFNFLSIKKNHDLLRFLHKEHNDIYNKLFGENKFIILSPHAHIKTEFYGNFIKDENLWFSNDFYKKKEPPFRNTYGVRNRTYNEIDTHSSVVIDYSDIIPEDELMEYPFQCFSSELCCSNPGVSCMCFFNKPAVKKLENYFKTFDFDEFFENYGLLFSNYKFALEPCEYCGLYSGTSSCHSCGSLGTRIILYDCINKNKVTHFRKNGVTTYWSDIRKKLISDALKILEIDNITPTSERSYTQSKFY